jgi:hypothetical protein
LCRVGADGIPQSPVYSGRSITIFLHFFERVEENAIGISDVRKNEHTRPALNLRKEHRVTR